MGRGGRCTRTDRKLWLERDVAVGYAEKYSTFGGFQGERAVRWDAGGVGLELGNLGTSTTGTTFNHANDINGVGVMVGYADKYDAAGNSKGQRAVKWEIGGGVHELGTLGMRADGSSVGEAYRLNSAGIAVGYARRYAADGTELNDTAVYWDLTGTAIELNTLIDPASGWLLNYANSITDTGWIAGIGSFDPDGNGPANRHLRLFSMQIPAAAAPEPGALGLLGVAVCCLAHRRPRRSM
jgi:hypothetical protein